MAIVVRRPRRAFQLRWVLIGVLVNLGAIGVGLTLAVLAGHQFNVQFASIDEYDISAAVPIAVLGAGILTTFPVTGYLLARASEGVGIIEAAVATTLALFVVYMSLGMSVTSTLVFALAFSPVAVGLTATGAWVGSGKI